MPRYKLIVFALVTLASPSSLHAQGGGFLEQLMRDLLESQRQRQQQAQAPPVVVGQRVPPATGRGRLATVRERLNAFGSECDTLSKTLRREVRSNRAVAPYLIEMVRVDARIGMLRRKYEKQQADAVILADLQELDREWRDVSFRLGQVPGLSDACTQSLDRMDQLCEACCSVFEVAPQIDRREVARLADTIAAELHHLERDIEYEVRQRRKAIELIVQAQRVEGVAKLVGEAAHQGDPMEVVVDAFRRFARDWRPLASQLDGLNNRRIDRSVLSVRELVRGLRRHLRLRTKLDRSRLTSLANLAHDRVRALFDSVSLGALMRRPDAAKILAAAQLVDRQAEGLCGCVGSSSRPDIAEHWRSFHSSWVAYDSLCQPIYQPKSNRLRQDLLACLEELRCVVGVSDVFDRVAVTRCAADLASVAGEAEHRVALWSSRPGARVDAKLIRQAKSLIDDCRSLHENCAAGFGQAELAADCRRLAEKWARLRPQLLACRTVDQRVLRRLADDATTHLLTLQGLLDVPTST